MSKVVEAEFGLLAGMFDAGVLVLPVSNSSHMLISPSFRLASEATLSSGSDMGRDDPTQEECR